MFKIAKIEACAVAIPLKMPIKMSGILIETCDNLIVKVTDSEGNVGWGEASSAPTMTGETAEGLVAATKFMASRLDGAEVTNHEGLVDLIEPLMHANHREDVKEARSGDIIAIAGLKNVTTGDTLCESSKPIILERMEFPDPVIEVAVEPKTKADQEKMGVALGRLAAEDPSFRVTSDHDSGQTIIKGMGELHLDILVDRMKREFKVEANVGAPQVAYRETITTEADIDYTHKKQSGGAGQFARVKMVIKPGEPGCGLDFENTVVGGNIPKEYIPGVEKGVGAAMTFGVVAGFPVTDVKVVLYDGAYHDVDSSVMAFELAGRAGFREGLQKAGPKLLEPVMRVEVVTPEDFVGDVIGDLNSRRGQVQGMEPQGVNTLVKSMVPLATMFGYVNNLRSLTQGRASYSMFFEKYEQCPEMIAEEVKKKMA